MSETAFFHVLSINLLLQTELSLLKKNSPHVQDCFASYGI